MQDITRTREFEKLLSESELVEKMDLLEYSRQKTRLLLRQVQDAYPATPQNARWFNKKSVIVINEPAFKTLLARAKVRSAFAKSLERR